MSKTIKDQLMELFDPKQAPQSITIYRDRVKTTLLRITREDGTMYWVGTPQLDDGRVCRYALVVEPSGYVGGSAAINFITSGGWQPNLQKPSAEDKSRAVNDFRRSFLQACLVMSEMDQTGNVAFELERLTGLEVESGTITSDDMQTIALMGLPYDAVRVAQSSNLRFKLDVPRYLSRFVQTEYATCETGDWNEQSEEVACTSSLRSAQVMLMKRFGFRFRRVEQKRRRK